MRTPYDLIARLSQARGSQEGAIRSGGGGCVVYAVRPHRPPPKSGMVWRVARLVRTPYYVPHRPPLPRGSQEGAIRRAGAPGMCRVRSTSPSPPSQEWHGVASGEACGVYVRVRGVWGACRTRLALHRAEQKETTDSLFPLFY